jgi:hypothetical protein
MTNRPRQTEWNGDVRRAVRKFADAGIREAPPTPIIPFPLQRHIRKAHVALDLRDGQRPRLTIDTTGSGNRLPLALWRRPEDVDLLREGLLGPDDLPRLWPPNFDGR